MRRLLGELRAWARFHHRRWRRCETKTARLFGCGFALGVEYAILRIERAGRNRRRNERSA